MDAAATGFVRLDSSPIARNKATASRPIVAGQIVIAVTALSTALLPQEKGRRCDACHLLASQDNPLLRCSGCAAFWYCSGQCQMMQWRTHHWKICKAYNRYIASPEYQALPAADRVDAVLLSQLIAEVFPQDNFILPPKGSSDDAFATFLDLMRNPQLPPGSLPICRSRSSLVVPANVTEELYSHFGNNNFIIHSHLNSIAHGIFPLASRLFNHSCVPNSVARYIITPRTMTRMEIVSLKNIAEGEEICIPYLDPALPYDTRQIALRSNYNFDCICSRCAFESRIQPLPPLPQSSDELRGLEAKLCEYVFGSGTTATENLRANAGPTGLSALLSLPKELYPLLNERYLPNISEEFSQSSHMGQYDVALTVGRTLFALYTVLYPMNFPQIGMHALEMAKTVWNTVTTQESDVTRGFGTKVQQKLANDIRVWLELAREILGRYEPEGDEGGPLEEMYTLRSLLFKG